MMPRTAARFEAILHRLTPLLALLAGATLALIAGFYLGHHRPEQPPRNLLTVAALSVGNGEAGWIKTPKGRFILIGGGPPGQGKTVVRSLIEAGAERIDLLILPYPYAEAIGGIPDILDSLPVAEVIEPGDRVVNQWQSHVRFLLAQKHVPVQIARAGWVTEIDGVKLEILAPAEPLIREQPASANNSVVVRVRYEETAFLWAGGLDRAGEDALLGRMPALRSNWLRVARFGTRNASSPEFLYQVQPEFAVISSGPNRDGYPHNETLDRLAAAGTQVYRTDTAPGGLLFQSDGTLVLPPGH